MTEEHKGLPVAGYRPQTAENVALVNQNKQIEEGLLRLIDELEEVHAFNPRWLAIGRTHIEQGFMAINRAVFNPSRVKFDGDQG